MPTFRVTVVDETTFFRTKSIEAKNEEEATFLALAEEWTEANGWDTIKTKTNTNIDAVEEL